MCFPFTPNTVVNFVASFSHIKMKNYFIILLFSKLISISFLAVMGREVTTFLTHPIRAIILIIVTIVIWFIGKELKNILWEHMRSDILRRIISTSISIILAIIFVMFIQIFTKKRNCSY